MMKPALENSLSQELIEEIAARIESAALCMEIDALLINHGYAGTNYSAELRVVSLDLPPSKQILSFIKNCHEDGDLK